MITLDEAKAYLRVDSDFEDTLISALLSSAEVLCADVARITSTDWNAVTVGEAVVIRGGQVAQDSRGVFELNCRQELAIGTRVTGQLFFVKGLRGVEDLFWRVAE